MNDSNIAKQSGIVTFLKQNGEWALADRAYCTKDNMLVTFKKPRGGYKPEQRLFNYLLRHWRDAVERVNQRFKVFQVLDSRFRAPISVERNFNFHKKLVFILTSVVDFELGTIKPLNKMPTPKINQVELKCWYQRISNTSSSLEPFVSLDIPPEKGH